jgi:O-antigen ligase
MAWLVACAVSLVGAVNPAVGIFGSHHSYDGLLHQAAYLVLFVASTRLEPGELIGPVCLGASLAAAYVLVQAVGLDPIVWRNEAGFGGYVRPFGTLGHPNHAGAVMAMALTFALSSRAWWRWPVVGVLVLACVVTISRAAWAGMAAGAGVWWAASRR